LIVAATNAQMSEIAIDGKEERDEFRLATDGLNFHRVEWRLREELGEVDAALLDKVKGEISTKSRDSGDNNAAGGDGASGDDEGDV